MSIIETNYAAPAAISLEQQRLLLRGQLASQRQVIEYQLGPSQAERKQWHPRSKTMNFLMQRPELVKRLLGQFTGLVLGASLLRSMHPVLAIAKFLHSSAKPRR